MLWKRQWKWQSDRSDLGFWLTAWLGGGLAALALCKQCAGIAILSWKQVRFVLCAVAAFVFVWSSSTFVLTLTLVRE
eukprot:scaffold8651_cov141-Skeletonema_dohrnii-CCMP3373.AAC.3